LLLLPSGATLLAGSREIEVIGHPSAKKHADWRQIRSIHDENATRMRQKTAKFQGFPGLGRKKTLFLTGFRLSTA
jgi:hypothetical protein